MSDASTRVVLPWTGAPPGFDVNVVNGRVSCCFSQAPNANSLFFTIGPPAQRPPVRVVKFSGLTRLLAAFVPTNPEHVSTTVMSEQFSLRVRKYPEAVKLLVPLRVTVFTPAPVKLPCLTS